MPTLFGALNCTKLFGDHFENLKELSTHQFDFTQEVFPVDVVTMGSKVFFLSKSVLFFDELEPWAHIAELLKELIVGFCSVYSLAVGPSARDSLPDCKLTGSMEFASTLNIVFASINFEMFVYFVEQDQKCFTCISLLIPSKVVIVPKDFS